MGRIYGIIFQLHHHKDGKKPVLRGMIMKSHRVLAAMVFEETCMVKITWMPEERSCSGGRREQANEEGGKT